MNVRIFKRRVYITGLLIMSIACFFIYRFASLHFSAKIYLNGKALKDIKRGAIKDSKGDILAVSIEQDSLFANPGEIDNPVKVARTLSPLLGISEGFITRRLSREKRFIWLKRKLGSDMVHKIRALGIKGLYFRKEYKRVYPQQSLASNLIGFVGIDNKGLEGMEYKYDKILTDGIRQGGTNDYFIRGNNVVISIDNFIQYAAESELEKGIGESDAKQAVAVIMEIKSGRILALAKYPSFDPNNYRLSRQNDRKNYTVVDSFEPGSTLKVLAMAMVLAETPEALKNKFFCPGKIDIADETINCTSQHGYLVLDDIIKYSCNVGIIKAMKKVPRKKFYATLLRFGLGALTHIELPGESRGILRPTENWSGLSKYSMALGQEISVTSVQLVAAFGAIANRGIYIAPRIIDRIVREDGTVLKEMPVRSRGRIIREDIALRLLYMMRGVVKGGTGMKASLQDYEVAGKTGTAQKSMVKGGYLPDKFVVSFVGMMPYRNPEICMLVLFDEPKMKTSGGQLAAPVFARIAARILPYLGIKKAMVRPREPLQKPGHRKLKKVDRVPDFRGMSLAGALKLLIDIQKTIPLEYSFIGEGRVYNQAPPPGEKIRKGQKIILQLREN